MKTNIIKGIDRIGIVLGLPVGIISGIGIGVGLGIEFTKSYSVPMRIFIGFFGGIVVGIVSFFAVAGIISGGTRLIRFVSLWIYRGFRYEDRKKDQDEVDSK